jgi:hypothetical protein
VVSFTLIDLIIIESILEVDNSTSVRRVYMETLTKKEYNAEPVYYCKHCLSLKIRGYEEMDYCDDCGSTNTGKCSIEEWEELYKNKFGHKYLDKY